MCGLVGMAGNLIGKYDKVLKHLLILDSLRGEDSTGIAAVNKFTGQVSVAKQLGDPFALFQDKRFENAMGKVNRAIIGHNRWATSGGISKRSAHPFDFETLVGVHNGTLSSKHKLLNADDYKVDSENLYHHIEQRGIDDAIAQLGAWNNAWALVWWDKVHETLNFLRNKERPLYICRTVDGEAIFWASESWMLYSALNRNDVKFGDVFPLEEDILHSIHIDDKGKMDKPKTRRVAAPAYVYQAPANDTNVKQVEFGGTKEKKPESGVVVVGQAAVTSATVDSRYLNLKGVLLETLSINRDNTGNEYVQCFDAKNPFVDVRLYIRPQEAWLKTCIGRDITGDISGWSAIGRGYYKVSPWTAKLVAVVEAEDKEEEEAKTYISHNAKELTKEEWEKQYSVCGWCSSSLDADAENRFTTAGECLCPECAADKEITQYVNLLPF